MNDNVLLHRPVGDYALLATCNALRTYGMATARMDDGADGVVQHLAHRQSPFV